MDEYLFLTLAKLKADRRKLEREQRESEQRTSTNEHWTRTDEPAQPPTAFPLLNWR